MSIHFVDTPSGKHPVIASLPTVRNDADPRGICLTDDARTIDNAAFAADVAGLGARLIALGLEAGDVVAVLLPNRCEIVTTMFAAWQRGAALTPVNPALTDDEITYQLRDSNARVLVGDSRSAQIATALGIGYIDVETIHVPGGGVGTAQVAEPPAVGPDDHALIVYTSGTTGRPKGCVLDHSNVHAMVESIAASLSLGPEDRSLLVLPLFHCNGLIVGVLSVLMSGGTVVVGPRFSAESFWDAVEHHRPTYFSAVPTMYALLHAHTERRVDTSSLRLAICGAAPMSADLLIRFEERFGFPLVEGYGLSECTVAATINPIAGPRKPGTVGPALPGQEVVIEDGEGRRLPVGEAGEVIIKGANVMRGYLGRPDETAKVLKDGWLHTGDVGYLDEDGYLVLVDRIKDMIIRGGENIYPKEIETALYELEDVMEAAVVGRPDEIYGEVPIAYVAARPGRAVDVGSLRAHCSARLARYKVPREFHVVSELPKNSVGKIVKSALRQSSR